MTTPETLHYPLACNTWDEAERDAAIAVIESGQLTMGEKVQAFERRFAEMFGAKHAVMVNSGSSANLLAVAALFYTREPLAQPRSVAVVPAVSWATTYYPLCQYGLTLRFVDIDPETLNFDLAALERALDDEVTVIFAVNLLGNPNDYDAIKRLIGARPITLIEDNCESMGATFAGRFAGCFGRIGTFSTYFSHHISTMEGGVCITDDDELHEILLCLRSHGWTRRLPWPNHLTTPDPRGPFHEAFRFILPGYNVRPLEICAAAGLEQLAKLPDFIAQRRDTARRLKDRLRDMSSVRLQKEIGQSSWFGFALTLTAQTNADRDTVVAKLAAVGVECRPVVAGSFINHPVMAHLAHEPSPVLPNAEEIDRRGFYIGNNAVDDGALDRLADALRWALAEG
jgi:CDP-6-deoxy-D-xylo-4-hexulose-3-dehydrase